jgi:hypothetical protein
VPPWLDGRLEQHSVGRIWCVAIDRLILPSMGRDLMSDEKRALLEKLKFELAFVEDGGYGRSVRTPHKSTSPFQDSLTCLNFGDPSRAHPCAECILMQYVPESRKSEDVPCHHIPLDGERTIATLDAIEAEEVLKHWLHREINRLEGEAVV